MAIDYNTPFYKTNCTSHRYRRNSSDGKGYNE